MVARRRLVRVVLLGNLPGIEALARTCRSGVRAAFRSAARRLRRGFPTRGCHGVSLFDASAPELEAHAGRLARLTRGREAGSGVLHRAAPPDPEIAYRRERCIDDEPGRQKCQAFECEAVELVEKLGDDKGCQQCWS